MSALISYQFDESPVRVVMIADNPWFVAGDICAVLGIKNSRDALVRLDEDEKGVAITDTLGGRQEMNIISESGMYALIFRSRLPQAQRFRKWVTSEVLPSIRRAGLYQLAGHEPPGAIGEEFDPVALNAKVAVVREARRLYGPARARAIWVRIGLPLGIADARADFAGDDLAGPLRDLLAGTAKPMTTAEAAAALGLDPDHPDARRRLAELLRLLGWYSKRTRRGADLVWAWFPASETGEV